MSQPKRFLCLGLRTDKGIAIRNLESWGSAQVPYQPHDIRERLDNLQSRGFHVVTDSQNEMWETYPHIQMMERTYTKYINRDYALDQLVQYHANRQIQLPNELKGVIPNHFDFRRTSIDPHAPYEFRAYRAELHVLLLCVLAMLHPPVLGETWIDEYFNALGTVEREETESDRYRTFRRITTTLDQELSVSTEERRWGET